MRSVENAKFAMSRLSAGLCHYPNKAFALNCYMDALEWIKEAIEQAESEMGETDEQP